MNGGEAASFWGLLTPVQASVNSADSQWECLVPWALNRLIPPVLLLGTVVRSSPLPSMTRSAVSPSSMVTMRPACGRPTWMRWRATWMPPRMDTFRWMTVLAGGSGSGPASRALQLVPLGGWDRARQGPPQQAVLGDDVHDRAVQADPGPLPGQRRADHDDLVAQR
jgi:hypothetical protein